MPGIKAHALTISLSAGAGITISFWPYFLWWRQLHQWIFIADPDNLLYLQISAQPYYSTYWRVADPVNPNHPTLFSWLFFVPAAKLARALGANPLAINEIWHLWAALGIALAVYWLFFHYLERRWLAAGCAIFVMADAGCLVAQPFIGQLIATVRLLSHPTSLLSNWPPVFLEQWRIVDPALGLPFLLMQIILLARARERPTWRRISLAGVSFGLLFYVYFYFWTAAAGALVVAFLLDKRQPVYFHILWIGLLFGAPLLASNLLVRHHSAPDALARISYFLPVPRLSFVIVPKAGLIGCLLAAAWIWMNKRGDVVYLLSLAVSAILLSNSHVITGLDLRAGHWRMVWGGTLEILLLIAAADIIIKNEVGRGRKLAGAGAALVCCWLLLGLFLVRADTLRNKFAAGTLARYVRFSAVQSANERLVAGSVIAGDQTFCDYSAITRNQHPLSGYAATMSLWLDDANWETRMALNQYLSGTNYHDFRTWAHNFSASYQWGPWSVGIRPRSDLFAGLMTAYARVASDPSGLIAHYRVRYVAIAAGQRPPAYLEAHWKPLPSGPSWQLWERPAAATIPGFTLNTGAIR